MAGISPRRLIDSADAAHRIVSGGFRRSQKNGFFSEEDCFFARAVKKPIHRPVRKSLAVDRQALGGEQPARPSHRAALKRTPAMHSAWRVS
jgi:hypothetical protein